MLGRVPLHLAAAIAVASCADLPECEQPLQLCDIGDASCREHVFVQTACARDFDGRDVPPVHTITRDQFEALLRGDGEPTESELRADAQYATALRMLALLPDYESSGDDAEISALARNVLAFYSREDQDVTIVSTNLANADREQQVFVLSHEFVHAQQDVDIGLGQFFDAHVTSTDSEMAIRSLTEGEAVLFSNVTLARQRNHRLSDAALYEYYNEGQQELRDELRDRLVGITDLTVAFPYPFGGELVTDPWVEDGPAGVRARYDAPPASTAEIMRELDGDPAQHDVVVPPLAVDPLPEGWSILDEDTLGAWVVHAFAARNGADGSGADYDHGWIGDHLLVVGGPTDAEVVLLWRVRFADLTTAQIFGQLDEATIPEGVRSIEVAAEQVTIVMAPDESTLADWATRIVGDEVRGPLPEAAAPGRVSRRARPWDARPR